MTLDRRHDTGVEDIVRRLQAGGDPEESFHLLFRRYFRLVQRTFARLGLPPDECEDLTQETLLAVFAGLPRFRWEASFDSWVFAIARKIGAKAVYRKITRRKLGTDVSLDATSPHEHTEPVSDSPFEQTVVGELSDALSEALDGLPPQMRDCATLRLREGLTYREIAAALEITIGAVKVQLNRARKKLRYELSGFLEPSANRER